MNQQTIHWWPQGHDSYDWQEAFNSAKWYRAGAPGEHLPEPSYQETDIAAVELHHVSYHDEPYIGGEASTELTLYALLRFNDGTYGALDAWNDYTGWGCQDGADMRIGDRDAVIRSGMSQEMRTALGLSDYLDRSEADS